MTFEIIKSAEIPQNWKSGGGSYAKYPFAQMEVGDGFDAPRDMGKTKFGQCARQNSVGACARGFTKRHNPTAKFTVRMLDKNTVRCVRTA